MNQPSNFPQTQKKKNANWKMIIGLTVIFGAAIFLLVTATMQNMQYFITIDELLSNETKYETKQIRISGAVIGNTIHLDEQDGSVHFEIAHISGDHEKINEEGGMAKALEEAVHDPHRARIAVIYHGSKPDLLKDQTQAILTGHMTSDHQFEADELLLKCPTKYEGAMK